MRAFGYLRVSKERTGQISPDAQRSEIESHCEREGWTITEWFSDIDFSATQYRPLEMPGFSEMVKRAEDGEADVVVCYRVDRTVREHTGEWYVVKASLERSGVRMAFAGRTYDDSPEGDFALGLDVILARLESRRLGVRLRSMHKQLAQQGKYIGGVPPYGWQRVRDSDGHQRLVAHPEQAPIRRRMHELVAQGWSLQRIAEDLIDHQIATARGGQWKASKISEMLSSPLQYGARVKDGEEIITGRIEPLISRETFERTRAVLGMRKRWRERTTPRALRGNLVRCGQCGSTMRLHAGAKKVTYRCEGVAARSCGHGADIREHILWAEVESKVLKRLANLRPPKVSAAPKTDIDSLLDAENAATHALGRLVALYAAGEISEEEWKIGRAKANERLDATRKKLERARKSLAAPTIDQHELLRGVDERVWRELSADEQHSVLRLLIDHVEVNPRKFPPRVRIFWH